MLRIATAFSGIGAVEHALKRMKVSHELVFACDNDPHVKKSYFANYNIDEARWCDLVQSIDGKKYKGKVDLLIRRNALPIFLWLVRDGGLKMSAVHFFMISHDLSMK